MSPKHRFHVVAPTAHHGFNLSYCPSPPNYGDSLPTVFHRVEKVGEIAGSVSGTDFGHKIRLSDTQVPSTLAANPIPTSALQCVSPRVTASHRTRPMVSFTSQFATRCNKAPHAATP
jgi:hypothetical protein